MQYFKVKPQADQKQVSLRFKNQILVANELYTAIEVTNAKDRGWISQQSIEANLKPVTLSPKKTYWFFGARFHTDNAIVNAL
jgi:hypothetical protein